MAKVAWIGLGVMGYPMAGHLLKKGGHDLTVYNRNAAKAEAWVKEYGAGRTAATPAEAAKGAEFVFCCVGNDDDLRSVTTAKDGAFDGVGKGAVFIDNTTASANVARELLCRRQGRRASTSSMHPSPAVRPAPQNGVLTVMVGGDKDVFERAKPVIIALCAHGDADRRRRAPASSPRWSTRSASPASCRASPKASTSPRRPASTFRP